MLPNQALYENKHGVADSLARAWATVARELGTFTFYICYQIP